MEHFHIGRLMEALPTFPVKKRRLFRRFIFQIIAILVLEMPSLETRGQCHKAFGFFNDAQSK
jgi:hypothetical protein